MQMLQLAQSSTSIYKPQINEEYYKLIRPTDDEIKELEMYPGMSQSKADDTEFGRRTNEGSKLAGRADLWYPNGNLENNPEFGTIGFTALPGSTIS